MNELLLAKTMPPRRGGGILERPRIAAMLGSANEHRVAFIAAPAGYGKTIVMLQAAAAMQRKLVWYQLDRYDNDPVVFLRYLAASLDRQLAGFSAQVLPLLGGGAAGRQRLFVTAFVRAMALYEDVSLLVALDDYHVIDNSVVHQFMEDLLLHLPAHVQVMIASRTMPPLNIYRLRDTSGLLTLGAEELRFTAEEAGSFWPDGSAGREALLQRLNGWPAAVRFAAGTDAAVGFNLLLGENTDLHSYLTGEILSRQPAELAEFMQIIAVLEVITPEACDRLLERQDSRQRLAILYKRELLLSRLEGMAEAYRYHQLLREFLLERLGSERRHWQKKAGLAARRNGELSAAVEYFRAADDTRLLGDTIKEAGLRALGQGLWHTVNRWLDDMDGERLSRDPWLRYLRAAVAMHKGRLEEAEQWLAGLEASFAAQDDQGGLTESRLLQARIWRRRGLVSQSLELMEEVALQFEPEQSAGRFELPLEKALALLMLGRLQKARDVLEQALDNARQSGNPYLMAHLLEGLSRVSYMQGDYPRALQLYRQGAELMPDRVLPSYYAQDSVATIYQDWGELAKGLEYVKRNAAIKESLGLSETLPSAYLQMAGLYTDCGEWAKAEEYHARANQLLQDYNGERFFMTLNFTFWGQCLALQGRLAEARHKTETALSLALEQGGLVLAVCRSVGAAVFVQTGELQAGREMLAASVIDLQWMGFSRALCHALALQSWLHDFEGKAAVAAKVAREALELAARMQCQQFFLTQFQMLQTVLQRGLENGIEVSFVQHLLAKKGEAALPVLTKLSRHREPQVRLRVIAPLAEIGGSAASAVLARLTTDADTNVRRTALLAAERSDLSSAAAASASLQVEMLGKFKVLLAGGEFGKGGWSTAKARDLLAYLIHRGEPVSRERIQEDLWPEIDAANAANIFHVTLYRLRKLLSREGYAGLLAYRGKQYGLEPEGLSSDVQKFEELIAAGKAKGTGSEEQTDYLERAAALYRDDYLEEMDYPWLLYKRETLRNLHVEIRIALARHYLEARLYGRMITHLHRIEADDPFNEEIHALLIKAHAGQGSRTAVTRQYQKAQALFRKELGLSLSPELQALYAKLSHA